MNKEIEVKIKISNDQHKEVERWLEKKACFMGKVSHEEYYLDNPRVPLTFLSSQGYKDAHYYLRVRRSPEKGDSICLKKWHGDAKTGEKTHCDEWEFAVSDGKTALELLHELGFKDVTPIKKTRCTYHFHEFEIVIDVVEHLGTFIEVELKEASDNIKTGLERIYGVIRQMGITRCIKLERGYTSMAWNPGYDFGVQIDLSEN